MYNWVSNHRPAIVVLENVCSAPWGQVAEKFEEIGYSAIPQRCIWRVFSSENAMADNAFQPTADSIRKTFTFHTPEREDIWSLSDNLNGPKRSVANPSSIICQTCGSRWSSPCSAPPPRPWKHSCYRPTIRVSIKVDSNSLLLRV